MNIHRLVASFVKMGSFLCHPCHSDCLRCGCGCHLKSKEMSTVSKSESSSLLATPDSCRRNYDPPVLPDNNSNSLSIETSQYHSFVGGAPSNNSLPSGSTTEGGSIRPRKKAPHSGPLLGIVSTDGPGHVAGELDSGLSSPSRRSFSYSQVTTDRGNDLHKAIKEAYKWKERFTSPDKEFLKEMDKLFMDCQVHLSDISAQSTPAARKEADSLVDEMIALRNHWGTKLLPTSICNAFIRERIYIDLGFHHYRIDSAQFFEPVPFYSQSSQNTGELMKLFRFSVYDLSREEVVIRYFLERSNVIQLYHVLCYTLNGQRGQIHPYGAECPTYWDLRTHMINDLCSRFQNGFFKT